MSELRRRLPSLSAIESVTRPRCGGLRYVHSDGILRTCHGCHDCQPAQRDSRVELLERKCEKLEALLREAVIYIEPSTNDGADLRARIARTVPKVRA